jgi:hypothetical protein
MTANTPSCCLHALWNVSWPCMGLAKALLLPDALISNSLKSKMSPPPPPPPHLQGTLRNLFLTKLKTLPWPQTIASHGVLWAQAWTNPWEGQKIPRQECNLGGLPTQVCSAYQTMACGGTLPQSQTFLFALLSNSHMIIVWEWHFKQLNAIQITFYYLILLFCIYLKVNISWKSKMNWHFGPYCELYMNMLSIKQEKILLSPLVVESFHLNIPH